MPSFVSGTRLWGMVKAHGLTPALATVMSVMEDRYLRVFDLKYGVKTSGYIQLDSTSIAGVKTRNLHRYRGVNAWAFRNMLRTVQPPKSHTFVDLGSGLGRACLLAAEYGFARVTGVELVPEFCTVAQRNVEIYQSRRRAPADIRILNVDAREYTAGTDDDFYFLFRPFSGDVLQSVCNNIRDRSARAGKAVTILYSERITQTSSNHGVFAGEFGMREVWTDARWGQRFWKFQFSR